MKKVKIKGIEKHDGYHVIRYKYADMKAVNIPLYGARQYGAIDELDAFIKFKRCMDEIKYEVVTDE